MTQKIVLCLLSLMSLFTGVAVATEEPSYRSILQQGKLEIREYPPSRVHSISVKN